MLMVLQLMLINNNIYIVTDSSWCLKGKSKSLHTEKNFLSNVYCDQTVV